MGADLMRSSGFDLNRKDGNRLPSHMKLMRHAVMGSCRFAIGFAGLAPAFMFHFCDRLIDEPGPGFEHAAHKRGVVFMHLSVLKIL